VTATKRDAKMDAFRYDGKRVLVVGGASGIGAAAAELALVAGAEVTVLDVADASVAGAKTVHLNLADKASIDAVLKECAGPVHALLSCAGVADGTAGIERINFIGHRYIFEQLLAGGLISTGAAIGFISSLAGLGWEAKIDELKEWISISDYDESTRWAQEHNKCDYFSTKQAICAYVATQAMPLLKLGIRINALCPGPTDTPLAQANKDTWLASGSQYRAAVGIPLPSPAEQAYPLLFLCSDAASVITGVNLITDQGRIPASLSDMWPPDKPIIEAVLGRR
jgi:NAD(P)-dependent dehydrogenase (short-subunit alcohol dehydrogenase family)